ncbi:MAG: sensor histidine kinase [Sphingomonadales bacterium]
MISANHGWVASRFARLSTGFKMLLILSLGLFPLGLIAILASVQSAQQARQDRRQEIQQLAELGAQRLDGAIERNSLTIRAASTAIAATSAQSTVCERTLARLASASTVPAAYALYGEDARLRCATAGFSPPADLPTGAANGMRVALTPARSLRFFLYGPTGKVEGLGEFPQDALVRLVQPTGASSDFRMELIDGSVPVLLHDSQRRTWARTVVRSSPVSGGQLQLRVAAEVVPMTAAEILMILLPVVMWISAAAIGWLIVDRLLLRPLVRMQRVVSAYRPGDSHLPMPPLASPAREIGELGQAFDQVTRTVARHEAELEAAVDRQTKLVREVHHRVKNNLQVVASLLNLHSRGSRNDEVAAAYASIQRRVDALAVVHRNHYAELEENRGVALKPLISELASNLRATAPRTASHMSISVNIDPCYVTQDVAVSVAFLITEIVEFAMFCAANGVRISLAGNDGSTATLTIESESLREGSPSQPELYERFDRVITGLSRQLRSDLVREGKTGAYSLSISVVEKLER